MLLGTGEKDHQRVDMWDYHQGCGGIRAQREFNKVCRYIAMFATIMNPGLEDDRTLPYVLYFSMVGFEANISIDVIDPRLPDQNYPTTTLYHSTAQVKYFSFFSNRNTKSIAI